MQQKNEIDNWNNKYDPWEYEKNESDLKRRKIILDEIDQLKLDNEIRVLDIGCGQGFITEKLKGKDIIGVDISDTAINWAKQMSCNNSVKYLSDSIFNLNEETYGQFDLIIITGVIYPHYIGNSNTLIYEIINKLLKKNGFLISVHISEWYSARFPLLLIKENYYPYREFLHKLQIYFK